MSTVGRATSSCPPSPNIASKAKHPFSTPSTPQMTPQMTPKTPLTPDQLALDMQVDLIAKQTLKDQIAASRKILKEAKDLRGDGGASMSYVFGNLWSEK